MVGMLAIAAAAAWLLAFFICAVVTRIPPPATGAAASWPGLAGEKPALVNLAVTRAQPTGAAYSATAAVRGLAVRLAIPAETSFRGQVIARWMETRGNGDSDWEAPCIAVDDGERPWSFEVSDPTSRQLALGDTVTVRAAPRAGKLLSLMLEPGGPDRGAAAPGQPARDLLADTDFIRVTPGPPGPLLTAEEVTAAVGRPVEATGFQIGMLGGIYRGEDLTVSVTVATGALGGLSSGPARRWGRPVPGIGDEAWLINRHHTVVFRVGDHTGKITVSGAASCALPPDVLPRLGTTVAGRLAGSVADRRPGGAPSPETLG